MSRPANVLPAQVTAGASTGVGTCTSVGQPIFVNGLTAGKREAGSPTYTMGTARRV